VKISCIRVDPIVVPAVDVGTLGQFFQLLGNS